MTIASKVEPDKNKLVRPQGFYLVYGGKLNHEECMPSNFFKIRSYHLMPDLTWILHEIGKIRKHSTDLILVTKILVGILVLIWS